MSVMISTIWNAESSGKIVSSVLLRFECSLVLLQTAMEFLANAKRRAQLKKINFFYGFRPIQYLSRIFGLWPFSIDCDPNGMVQKVCLRPCDILRAILSMGLYLIGALIFILRFRTDSEMFLILPFGFYMIRIVGLLTASLTIAMNIINRNKLMGILKQFASFDNEVSHGFEIYYQNLIDLRKNIDFIF